MYHKVAIEVAPLQAYVSALVFSPRLSLIRRLFEKEEPPWLSLSPPMPDHWSACLQTLEGHSKQVHSVAYSHDSKWLASASADTTIRVWDADSGACLRILKGHRESIFSVTFAHNSTRLASGSHDHTIKIWDIVRGVCLKTLKGHSDQIHSVAYSRDSRWLSSTSKDDTIRVWDVDNGTCLRIFKGHSREFASAILSYNSELTASVSRNGIVKIWDTARGICLKTLISSIDNVSAMAFSDDSSKLAVSRKICDDCHRVEIWNVARGVHIQTLVSQSRLINSIAFSHDSKKLAWSSGGTIDLRDIYGSRFGQMFMEPSGVAISVVFSHNSMRLASASSNGTVRVLDTNSMDMTDPTFCSAVSHDLTRLALAKTDNRIEIFDTTGACIQILVGHKSHVTTLSYSDNSMWLASGSQDRTIKIWDVNGACIQTLAVLKDELWEVAFSHDSMLLASSSSDKQIKVWHVKRGVCLKTIDLDYIPSGFWFDPSYYAILTDRGTIDLDLAPPLVAGTVCEPRYFQKAVALSTDNWIQYHSANVLWIPSEYRSRFIATSGNKIAVNVTSGRVWMCHIDFTKDVRRQHRLLGKQSVK